jgi:hypothetical protein
MADEYIRKEFKGGATRTTLAGALGAGDTSISLTSGSTFPTGTAKFVIVIDRGTATEEKILISSRSTNTLTVSQRGYDGTSAASHDAGAYVEHVLDAYTVDQANAIAAAMTTAGDIVYKTTTGDNTAFSRLAIGTTGYPLVSTGSTPAYQQVGAAGIASNAVTTAKIDSNAVTADKIATAVAGAGLAGGGGTALSVNVDGVGIEIATDTLQLKDSGVVTAKLANSAVTADKIDTAVAGNGLAGGAGSALSVNVDNSTVEINSDSLRVKDAGITNAKLSTASGEIGAAWTSTTPTLTNVTLGTGGTNTAYYYKIGKRAYWEHRIVLGTGGSITGSVSVALPAGLTAARSSYSWNTAYLTEAGVNSYQGSVGLASTTSIGIACWIVDVSGSSTTQPVALALLSSSEPFTWGANDSISYSLEWELA